MTKFAEFEFRGLVPVVVSESINSGLKVINNLREAGVQTIEVALRTPVALDLIKEAKAIPDLIVGAGTVITVGLLERAIEAKADFVVSPGVSQQIIRASLDEGVPILPGVATPTDVMVAMDSGVSHLKVFPAEQLGGPSYLRALLGPFPSAKFMPSGGLSSNNYRDYLAIKNVFAVSGSWMLEDAEDAGTGILKVKELSDHITKLLAQR